MARWRQAQNDQNPAPKQQQGHREAPYAPQRLQAIPAELGQHGTLNKNIREVNDHGWKLRGRVAGESQRGDQPDRADHVENDQQREPGEARCAPPLEEYREKYEVFEEPNGPDQVVYHVPLVYDAILSLPFNKLRRSSAQRRRIRHLNKTRMRYAR